MSAPPSSSQGRLVLVATPLGNRGDLSPRARQAILSADILYCEDTRSPLRLLGPGEVLPSRVSCFAGNESERRGALLALLQEGKCVVLISEAGMPGISDPGQILANAVWDAGYKVEVIPGPCAAITALAASGFSAQGAVFWGFAPRKGQGRKDLLQRMVHERGAVIFYEAANRVPHLLSDLKAILGPQAGTRRVLVARELSKRFEELRRATLDTLCSEPFEGDSTRGEFCVVLEGANAMQSSAAQNKGAASAQALWACLQDPSLKPRARARAVAELTGEDDRAVYEVLARWNQRPL